MQLATSSTSDPAAALPSAWIERVFARLTGFYGAKFLQQWAGLNLEAVKAVWAEELAGFSGEELGSGIDACRTRDWPPSLPEFLKLCRPPIEPVAAWYEAQHGAKARDAGELGRWSHPAVFYAYTEMAWEVKTGEWSKHGDRWTQTLKRVIRELELGNLPSEIPPPLKALPAPEPLTREEASRRAAELRVSTPGAGVADPKEWAHRLRSRERGGERLPLYSRKAWRVALGVEPGAAA